MTLIKSVWWRNKRPNWKEFKSHRFYEAKSITDTFMKTSQILLRRSVNLNILTLTFHICIGVICVLILFPLPDFKLIMDRAYFRFILTQRWA